MPTELVAFLLWLGSAAGVGAIKSEFLEHEKWFQDKSEQWKSRFTVFLTIALSVGGTLLIKKLVPLLGSEWLELITLILTPISIYLGGQKWHDSQHKPIAETNVDLSINAQTPVGSTSTAVSASTIPGTPDKGKSITTFDGVTDTLPPGNG